MRSGTYLSEMPAAGLGVEREAATSGWNQGIVVVVGLLGVLNAETLGGQAVEQTVSETLLGLPIRLF